jgi:ferric-dicitrate binding protein FerR (iron transport regulator)
MVVLDTLARGATLVEGGLRFKKGDSNSYVYSTDGSIDASIRHRLTIAPGAGVYRIQWTDGSMAWLKPGTTVDYPVDIRSAEMQLAGEAWFRVAHDPSSPITIGMPGGVKTRVLGTSFDIRTAAGGSESRVALFSGRVRVVKGRDSVLLKPGSQAITGGKGFEVKALADSNAVLGWLRPVVKTSYFDLNDADLLMLLPEIAGWYRVQVVNPLGLRGVGITGEFAHTTPLADLIESLNRVEGSHVRIYLQDDTIFVEPLKRGR